MKLELKKIPELKIVERKLWEVCRGNGKQTALLSATVTNGGKRLRPALVVLCGSFMPAPQARLIDVAVATELIHAASLVHDDIIDRSESRRGLPTISASWGQQQAVLYGDFLFARAFSLLAAYNHKYVLANMTKAISLMCEGEIEQSARQFSTAVSESEYMSYIYKKTAFFIAACCQAGGEICGLTLPLQKKLASFGLRLGYAFQITDDLLDFCGNSTDMGKPVLQDLREGHLTLPVIRLLENNIYGPRLRNVLDRQLLTPDSLTRVREWLEEAGTLAEVRDEAGTLVNQAKQDLLELPEGPARDVLNKLADFTLERSC